jgi:hypothetical protein
MVITSILVFPYWSNTFHVHMDSFGITLGNFVAKPMEGTIDQLVYFASMKF